MNKLHATGWIIACILAIILLLQQCGNGLQPNKVTTSDTTYVLDTNTYMSKLPDTKPIFDTLRFPVYLRDSINKTIDSAAVVQAYFRSRYYNDTLANDTNLLATLKYEVWMNEPSNMQFTYKLRRPQAIITNTTTVQAERNRQLYIGAGAIAEVSVGGSLAIGPEIYYTNKSNHLYTAGYYLPSQQLRIGVAFALWKKPELKK